MSTRRARIKAVTSLPPRRKNAESADVKNKQVQVKEDIEKKLKSPRTPRPLVEKNEVADSVGPSNTSDEFTNATKSRNVIKTPNKNDKANAPTTGSSPINPTEKIKSSPKTTEKVSGNATSVIKSNKGIFASPQSRRDSPFRKAIASLLTTSPKNTTKSADVNQAKSVSPQINKHTPKQQIINDNNELHITNKNIHKVTHNTVSPVGSSTTEDFNVPSVPESVTDETVMDGIVPLQQAGSAPKPIDVLKSEIISENVEVLFDPIVPLPSPSKVRPKLRPAPRLGPQRRNSIQGSASESEDETRRAQLSTGRATPSLGRQRHDSHTSSSIINREVHRVRNDSVCSSASQLTAPSGLASPFKEKQSKLRRQEAANRRAAAMRRKREKAAAKRESLTMYDLIFYNPTTNPIIPDQDEIKAKEDNAKDAKESAAKAEEKSKQKIKSPEAEAAPAPAPQIKLGANGEIVLDEQSLVINKGKGGKALESTMIPGITQLKENEMTTADEIIASAREVKTSTKDLVQPLAQPTVNNKTTPKVITKTASVNVTPSATAQAATSKGNTPAVPSNIETGSLVVLTVNDPSSPSKKKLQTYIAHGGGRLTPVSLPTTLLNSVVGYMKKGTPKNTTGSPHFTSPTSTTSTTSQDGRGSTTPGVIQVNPSPTKRQRLSSYTITQI
ncbi:PREDICTED: muscle M-line assembly protein unc-89 [Papilio polytes]|uniref:muscle M-line assembly protein unc-89 n=1 Tax=Papilio polytes TaxID=76194 RepID=UPI0006762D01|nr:PREDICTED: muscle M-line assembly protein unc-89 [Papilio polytes]